MEEGLDGFAFDAFSGGQAKAFIGSYIAAADSIGAKNFKVLLSADMSLGFSAADIVSTIATYGSNPHYLRLNGKPVLSTYGGSDKGNEWWLKTVIEPLRSAGIPITFIPYFDRPNPNRDAPSYDNWVRVIKAFPAADGLFNFLLAGSVPFYSGDPNLGRHWWSTLEGEENLAKALRDQNKAFIAPYLPYYWAVCHPARQYMEYQGGRGMENSWRSIVTRQEPQMVEIVTWNDYSESSYIQPTRFPATKTKGIPSFPHLGYYELLKYYYSWYHTGTQPTITKDGVFYFYRPRIRSPYFSTADPSCSIGAVEASQLWGNVQRVIYITTALTAPGRLHVISGGTTKVYEVPSGVTTTDVPVAAGQQTIELWRGAVRLVNARGIDIIEGSPGDNFNVFAGYAIAGADDSDAWAPSDRWKDRTPQAWFANPDSGSGSLPAGSRRSVVRGGQMPL